MIKIHDINSLESLFCFSNDFLLQKLFHKTDASIKMVVKNDNDILIEFMRRSLKPFFTLVLENGKLVTKEYDKKNTDKNEMDKILLFLNEPDFLDDLVRKNQIIKDFFHSQKEVTGLTFSVIPSYRYDSFVFQNLKIEINNASKYPKNISIHLGTPVLESVNGSKKFDSVKFTVANDQGFKYLLSNYKSKKNVDIDIYENNIIKHESNRLISKEHISFDEIKNDIKKLLDDKTKDIKM